LRSCVGCLAVANQERGKGCVSQQAGPQGWDGTRRICAPV
jgi:hypothetical protein